MPKVTIAKIKIDRLGGVKPDAVGVLPVKKMMAYVVFHDLLRYLCATMDYDHCWIPGVFAPSPEASSFPVKALREEDKIFCECAIWIWKRPQYVKAIPESCTINNPDHTAIEFFTSSQFIQRHLRVLELNDKPAFRLDVSNMLFPSQRVLVNDLLACLGE